MSDPELWNIDECLAFAAKCRALGLRNTEDAVLRLAADKRLKRLSPPIDGLPREIDFTDCIGDEYPE